MIYEPAEDSFLLQEQVRKFAKGKVLDIGTGSGIQAETSVEYTNDVLASDISDEAVNYVRRKGIKVIKSDLFEKIDAKFDLIIFNPPYLPLDEEEPLDSRLSTTGGKKGHEIIERFLTQAKLHLNIDGKILIVFSSLTGQVLDLFDKYKYKYKKLSEKKIDFETLYVFELNHK